jgi:hypothetical protein
MEIEIKSRSERASLRCALACGARMEFIHALDGTTPQPSIRCAHRALILVS